MVPGEEYSSQIRDEMVHQNRPDQSIPLRRRERCQLPQPPARLRRGAATAARPSSACSLHQRRSVLLRATAAARPRPPPPCPCPTFAFATGRRLVRDRPPPFVRASPRLRDRPPLARASPRLWDRPLLFRDRGLSLLRLLPPPAPLCPPPPAPSTSATAHATSTTAAASSASDLRLCDRRRLVRVRPPPSRPTAASSATNHRRSSTLASSPRPPPLVRACRHLRDRRHSSATRLRLSSARADEFLRSRRRAPQLAPTSSFVPNLTGSLEASHWEQTALTSQQIHSRCEVIRTRWPDVVVSHSSCEVIRTSVQDHRRQCPLRGYPLPTSPDARTAVYQPSGREEPRRISVAWIIGGHAESQMIDAGGGVARGGGGMDRGGGYG
ncbi:hypothetical protein DAI22_07g074750 [Oryza sativa Japonica Group]|nr:hypothetical protein DAI22_07g074750 [Oryza sativa Japonica Group]